MEDRLRYVLSCKVEIKLATVKLISQSSEINSSASYLFLPFRPLFLDRGCPETRVRITSPKRPRAWKLSITSSTRPADLLVILI